MEQQIQSSYPDEMESEGSRVLVCSERESFKTNGSQALNATASQV